MRVTDPIPARTSVHDVDRGDGNAALIVDSDDALRLCSNRAASQEIAISAGVLAPSNTTLARLIGSRRALFVVTPTVHELYGAALQQRISTLERPDSEVYVLPVSEATKNLDAVGAIAARASRFGLDRDGPLVAIGGGVCLDVAGVTAALFRRGIPNIKVPTTLVGLIDAGIGTKNSVNHAEHKSLLGTFSPPEASVLDATFLRTLPDRHLRSGVAEMLKMATIDDRALFDLLDEHGDELLRSRFQEPRSVATEAIRRSVSGMLGELSSNLYEATRLRKVDFGHTFSPYVETASGHRVLHGEAVAIDIAISSEIAATIGLLASDERDAILRALARCELPHHWAGTDTAAMYASLRSIREHRSGELHLVVPSGIGRCTFLEDADVSFALLDESVRRLAARSSAVIARAPDDVRTVNTAGPGLEDA